MALDRAAADSVSDDGRADRQPVLERSLALLAISGGSLPQFIPTMTLTGAVAFAQRGPGSGRSSRSMRWAFLSTCIISLFYLGLVVADIAQAFLGGGSYI